MGFITSRHRVFITIPTIINILTSQLHAILLFTNIVQYLSITTQFTTHQQDIIHQQNILLLSTLRNYEIIKYKRIILSSHVYIYCFKYSYRSAIKEFEYHCFVLWRLIINPSQKNPTSLTFEYNLLDMMQRKKKIIFLLCVYQIVIFFLICVLYYLLHVFNLLVI